MTGFQVEPAALIAFARRCEKYGDEMDKLSKQLQDATVGRDAFGHIPMVGSRIYAAYDQHVDQCKESAGAAASAVHSIGANAALTATHYEHAEHESTPR